VINSSALDFFLFLLGIFTMTLIGAILLRSACALFNLFAGAAGEPADTPAGVAAVAGPQTQAGSESTAVSAADQNWPLPQSTAITRTPLGERSLALEDDWEEQERIAALPGVPKPSLEWAMGIFFIATLLSSVSSFILFRVLRMAGLASGSGLVPIPIVGHVLGTLMLGGLNKIMLPTSFGKGIAVALLALFLGILVAAILAGLFFLIVLIFALDLTRLRQAIS
jgi:hypothetical protein